MSQVCKNSALNTAAINANDSSERFFISKDSSHVYFHKIKVRRINEQELHQFELLRSQCH